MAKGKIKDTILAAEAAGFLNILNKAKINSK